MNKYVVWSDGMFVWIVSLPCEDAKTLFALMEAHKRGKIEAIFEGNILENNIASLQSFSEWAIRYLKGNAEGMSMARILAKSYASDLNFDENNHLSKNSLTIDIVTAEKYLAYADADI